MKLALRSSWVGIAAIFCAFVVAGATALMTGSSAAAGDPAAQPVVRKNDFAHARQTVGAARETSALDGAPVRAFFATRPVIFEVNRGQTDSRVRFLSHGGGYTLFLTQSGPVLALRERFAGVRPISPLSLSAKSAAARNRGTRIFRENGNALRNMKGNRATEEIETQVLRMRLVGANTHAQIDGVDPLPGKVNYFIGNQRGKWVTDVPTYAKVRYRNVYAGVDLVFYGRDQNQLEYDFILAPGANPNAIKLRLEGAKKLSLSRDGDLIAALPDGARIVQHLPAIYQERDRRREKIDGRFVIRGKDTIGIALAEYDHDRVVSVDPKVTVDYSTYLGGGGTAAADAIAVDSAGDVYVTGGTGWAGSDDFPTKNAFQSSCPTVSDPSVCSAAFVAKFDPSQSGAASLLYSTYLGGSRYEAGTGIAVDSADDVYITGYTGSTDFPTTANAFQATCPSASAAAGCQSAFIVKLDPSASGAASLLYSTYLGGSTLDGGSGIAVDSADDVYVTGTTSSTDLPTRNAFQSSCPSTSSGSGCNGSAFVAKLDPSASAASSLLYSTYLGGSGLELGRSIAVDSVGDAFVTGEAFSTDFPTRNAFQSSCPSSASGCQAAFVAMLNPSASGAASLVYSTYLGGSQGVGGAGEHGYGIAVDSAGEAYVTGISYSTDFPVTKNAFQKRCPPNGSHETACAFVAKFDPSSSGAASLLYSTYLGGGKGDIGDGIAVDAQGDAYVTGETGSTDFPTKNAYQSRCPSASGPSRCGSAFVTKFNPSASGAASLVYSTYLGGRGGQTGGDTGYAIAVDLPGNAYVTGGTESDNFPTTSSAFQSSIGGGAAENVFVTKLALAPKASPVTLSISPARRSFGRKRVGTTTRGTFQVRAHLGKTSTTAVEIEGVAVNSSGDYSLDPATTCTQGQTLAGNASCKIVVDFTPSEWTKYLQDTGALAVTTNATNVHPADGVVLMKGGGR